MKRLLMTGMVVLAITLPLQASAVGTPPDQTAREVTDKIVGLIKQNRDAYAKDYKKLYAMVNEQLLPHFDFRKMSQQVLGIAWRNASEDQRTRFTNEFRDLLVRTYGTALLKYTDEKIVYLPLKIGEGDRTAVVRSQIQRSGGAPPIAINYSFFNGNEGWKIYDMAIEGPSIVTTYQRVYAQKLNQGGLDALIESMVKDNQRGVTGGTGAAAK
jgi:phospholipid transport system substrate-binding protein